MLSKSKHAILIVEDDESIRKLLVNILKSNNYTPFTASCSEDAMEIFADDGVALAREIDMRKPGLPIILMSGLNVKSTDWQIREAGISQVIQKPFTIEHLMDKVRQGLSAEVNI